MADTTTTLGRRGLIHPDLGYSGGMTLHGLMTSLFSTISNQLNIYWSGALTLANTGTIAVNHMLATPLTSLKVTILEASVVLTEAQKTAGYTITQTNTNTVSVQNISGGSKTFEMYFGIKVSVANSDIDGAAAIAYSKLASLTVSRAVESNASGVVTASAVTSAELNYLTGVTSSIQTQLNAKQATGSYITSLTGNVTASGPGAAVATIASGAVTNAMIATSAGIPYSKLTLAGTIIDADVSATAAIADSKLATISTPGKVSNSATTALSTSGANTIVARDGSGAIAVGNLTAKVVYLGDINSGTHNIVGGVTSGYQLSVQSTATGGSGLLVRALGGNGTNVQAWMVGALERGSVGTDGKFIIGTVSGTLLHDINGGTSYSAIAAPATPAAGYLSLYAKSDKKFYSKDDAGVEKAVGSGSGGGLNYVQNPDSESGITSWTANGTLVAGTNFIVTTANKLRGNQSFSVTGGSAGNELSAALFNPGTNASGIDSRDTSSTLKISFDFNNTGAAGDWAVFLYDTTNTTYITPNLSSVPGGRGTFEAVVPTTTSTAYTFVIRRIAGSSALYFDKVSLGPQEVIIGPAVTGWKSYTPTETNKGTAVWSGNGFSWKQSGDEVIIIANISTTTVGSAAGTYTFSSPLPIDAAFPVFGVWGIRNSATAAYATIEKVPGSDSFRVLSAGSAAQSSDLFPGTSSPQLFIEVRAKLLNASANLQIANNNVEWAFNTSTTTADDTTSFGNGPQGAPIYAFAPSGLTPITKRVRFQTLIQASDVLTLEIFLPSRGWMSVGDSSAAFQQNDGGTTSYGMRWFRTTSGSTDCEVMFQSNVDKNGSAWAAFVAGFWRLRKSSGVNVNALVGDRIGVSDGSAAAAGFVGELIPSAPGAAVSVGASGASKTITSISLTAGEWDVTGVSVLTPSGATTLTSAYAGLSRNTNNYDQVGGGAITGGAAMLSVAQYINVGPRRVTITGSGATPIYLLGETTYTGGAMTWAVTSYISARRIR